MEQQEEKKASYPEEGVTEDVTQAPAYDDESSFCNCENNKCLTPYESDRSIADTVLDAEDETDAPPPTQQPCNTSACAQPTATERIKKDLLALWHNPYIKRDHTCRIDLYRNKGDTEPIDCFESKSTHAFSARAMLLLGASLLGIWALTRVFGKE